jgi:DNA-binding transcriptional MerR regulator
VDKEDIFMKAYSVKDVSEKLDIPPGTIRQWERSLDGILIIQRDEKKMRYYTEFEISILRNIKTMREKGMSFELIKEVMSQSEDTSKIPTPSLPVMSQSEAIKTIHELKNAIESIQDHLGEVIKKEVEQEVSKIKEVVSSELNEQRIYIETSLNKRDQKLVEILREIQETKRLSSEGKKQWWKLWKK